MRAESEVRREAVVVGPGKPGFLQLELAARRGSFDGLAQVPADRVPPALRVPNTRVVAVTGPEGVLRVESEAEGRPKLEGEERIRRVLNEWDPLGVADELDDEYDSYIGAVLELLRSGAGEPEIAAYLRNVEHEWMASYDTTEDRRRSIASRLRSLSPFPGEGTGDVPDRGG